MMGDSEGPKLSGIWQIVRLKEILQKWQAVTLGSKEDRAQLSTQGGISPVISRRLTDDQCGDSDDEGCGSPEPPGGIQHQMMGDSEGPKLSGIWQIVRLKEILQKWQAVTLGSKEDRAQLSTQGGISPVISRRLTDDQCGDSDDEGCGSPEPPGGIPKGYLAVYVGTELRRFVIPTAYLSDPLFKVLLEKVEEEYGFNHSGGLTIPCETETFKYLLQCMENKQRATPNNISVAEQMATELTDNSETQSRG